MVSVPTVGFSSSSPVTELLKVLMPLPREEPISGSRLAPNISMITNNIMSSSGIPSGPILMAVTFLLSRFYLALGFNDNKNACPGTIVEPAGLRRLYPAGQPVASDVIFPRVSQPSDSEKLFAW